MGLIKAMVRGLGLYGQANAVWYYRRPSLTAYRIAKLRAFKRCHDLGLVSGIESEYKMSQLETLLKGAA